MEATLSSRPGAKRSVGLANPTRFARVAAILQPWLWGGAILALAVGLGAGLFFSPPDWQQGETVRIIHLHVPSAWFALSGYLGLAAAGASSLVWRHPLGDVAAEAIAPVGAVFTAVCLATGSIWGRPMWGTWWVWDARLTSMLILFLLFLGHIALFHAFDDRARGARSAALLALIGTVNLPIVKFSVDWWNTLHQPASVTRLAAPGIHADILWPMLVSALGFGLLFAALVVTRMRTILLERRARALLLQDARNAA